MFGDFDAISHAMSAVKGAKLIASTYQSSTKQEQVLPFLSEMLEYRDVKGQEEFFQTLFTNKYNFEVKFPISKSPELVFLKICVDSLGRNNCQGAKTDDIGNIFKNYNKKPVNTKLDDYTYFLQPVVIDKDYILIFSDVINVDNIKEAEKLIIEAGLLSDENLTQGLLAAATLASLPITQADNKLQISLPIYSKIKCGQNFETKSSTKKSKKN